MSNSFVILYASQTGNAQRVAEEIYDAAPNLGLQPFLYCVSLIDRRFILKDITWAVLIISTTGDGESPESAVKFYRRISRRILPSDYLDRMNYALLALGDSSYVRFCKFGRLVEERLHQLGAHCFYDTAYADDRSDYDSVVYSWIFNLWPALQTHLGLPLFSLTKLKSIFSFDACVDVIEEKNLKMNAALPKISNSISIPNDVSINDLPSIIATFSQKSFNTPNLPQSYLTISYRSEIRCVPEFSASESQLRLAADPGVIKAQIISSKRLTKDDEAVKKTLELTLQFEDEKVEFIPGDAFGFLCRNPTEEINYLLERLGLLDVADVLYDIQLLENSPPGKRVPPHLPTSSTLRHVFSSCIDLRSVPKKVLLRILASYTYDENHRLSLELLSSHEGLALFKECIQKPSLSILDLLEIFPSCSPPVTTLLEYLPHLRPRFYSIASSPLTSDKEFRIVFNVIELERKQNETQRYGICTGWLNNLTIGIQLNSNKSIESVESEMSHLLLDEKDKLEKMPSISIYKRKNQHFSLPNDTSRPLIMIGPGTGIAPFLGFLQHREKQIANLNTDVFGDTWLFYGCRYKEKDFLYRKELERLQSSGILTHLILCFSRDEDLNQRNPPRHVQENIRLYSKNIIEVVDNGGIIYICGDAKEMSRDVRQTFIDIFKTLKGYSEDEAQSFLMKLDREKRYCVDVWT